MKSPITYTTILKAITKAKTKKQITKVQKLVCGFNGSYTKWMSLIEKYNHKNRKITYPTLN